MVTPRWISSTGYIAGAFGIFAWGPQHSIVRDKTLLWPHTSEGSLVRSRPEFEAQIMHLESHGEI